MQAHAINSQSNFISGWYSRSPEDLDLLARLRGHIRVAPDRRQGTMSAGFVDLERKSSFDCTVPKTLITEYRAYLQRSVDQYILQYPWSNGYSAFDLEYPAVIQQYPPGGHFQVWHTERAGSSPRISSRHLVFMTYLNNLNNGSGHTEFHHQKLSIQPEEGLTLIWPADWMFTHRGCPVVDFEKLIVTGWLRYV